MLNMVNLNITLLKQVLGHKQILNDNFPDLKANT